MKYFFWLCLLLVVMTVFLEFVHAAPSKSLQSKNAPGKSKAAKAKNKRPMKGRKNKGRRRDGEEDGEIETITESPELETEEPEIVDPSEEDEDGSCMQCFDPCACFGWGSSNARRNAFKKRNAKKRQAKKRQTKSKSSKAKTKQG